MLKFMMKQNHILLIWRNKKMEEQKQELKEHLGEEYLSDVKIQIKKGLTTIEDEVIDIYHEEWNYNNGDVTSGQSIFTQEQLKIMMEQLINSL